MSKEQKILVKAKPLNVDRLGELSFKTLVFDQGRKFHAQTRLAAKLDSVTWYILAEGIYLSMQDKRWREKADSFVEYWKERGVGNEKIQELLDRYNWLQEHDDTDRKSDPPGFNVMGIILDSRDLFVEDAKLRKLALVNGYGRAKLEEAIRARDQGDRIQISQPAMRAYKSLTQAMDRINPQLSGIGQSLDEKLRTLTTPEKQRIVIDLEKILDLINQTMPDDVIVREPAKKPEYVPLLSYLSAPAKVIAQETKKSVTEVKTKLQEALTKLPSYRQNNIFSYRRKIVVYDKNRQAYLSNLVLDVVKEKYRLQLKVSGRTYSILGGNNG